MNVDAAHVTLFVLAVRYGAERRSILVKVALPGCHADLRNEMRPNQD
jgi:hypothetical protein